MTRLENNRESRLVLLKLLKSAGVSGLHADGVDQKFLDGEEDLVLATLHIDSLAAMEVCISLESHFGLSLSPVEFLRIRTLSDLEKKILSQS